MKRADGRKKEKEIRRGWREEEKREEIVYSYLLYFFFFFFFLIIFDLNLKNLTPTKGKVKLYPLLEKPTGLDLYTLDWPFFFLGVERGRKRIKSKKTYVGSIQY